MSENILVHPGASRAALPALRVGATIAGIPVYVYAVSLASLFTIVGIIWDISWHTTIGRDTLLSPPHLLIYLGAVFGGLFSGIQVIINTFWASEATRQSLVKVWGFFYSSLGAMCCIWGAVAMLTSAPFDDWWHNTYGLDVEILSPPHSLLGLGMLFLQFGACVSLSKYLNKNEDLGAGKNLRQQTILRVLFVVAAASLLTMILTLGTEFLETRNQHRGLFYNVAIPVVLLFLPAFGRAMRVRWGMTWVALGYFLILAGSNWILQIFPAEPRLGPILNHVTHYQPLQFPLLLFVPAAAGDLIMQRVKNDWLKALLISFLAGLLLLAVQYPLSSFLLESPAARHWFFGSHSWYYGADPGWEFRYKFAPWEVSSAGALASGIGIGMVLGFLTGRLSLRWGKWLNAIQR